MIRFRHFINRCKVRTLMQRFIGCGNTDPLGWAAFIWPLMPAWQTYERLGTPEGEIAITQAVVYCACAPPTQLMKLLDYGKDYRYVHDEPDAFAAGVDYLTESLIGRGYYLPVDRGLEIKIKEKLDYFHSINTTMKREKE